MAFAAAIPIIPGISFNCVMRIVVFTVFWMADRLSFLSAPERPEENDTFAVFCIDDDLVGSIVTVMIPSFTYGCARCMNISSPTLGLCILDG